MQSETDPVNSSPHLISALVVEDNQMLAELVQKTLSREGYEVKVVGDGASAIKQVQASDPDLILLDLGLPGLDGIEVCKEIRALSDAYIIIVTARDSEIDKVVGLTVGADDYLTKPLSSRELMARIAAMLRRPRKVHANAEKRVGDIVVRPDARTVMRGAETVELTRLEFDLLDTLASQPGVTFSRSQLIEAVWGPGWVGDQHVVDVHMANVRRKLEHDTHSPRCIHTVRGIGYRLEGPS